MNNPNLQRHPEAFVPDRLYNRPVVTSAISISELDSRRQVYEDQGFDCVDWHLGFETEILVTGYSQYATVKWSLPGL
jgi:hypothetical protein